MANGTIRAPRSSEVIEIQGGSQITGSTNNFADFTDTRVVPKTVQGFTTIYETSKSAAIIDDDTPVSKFQDGSRLTGSSNISETMTYICHIYVINMPTVILQHCTMTNSQEVYFVYSNNDGQPEMAAKTGNTYISETMKGAIKIPTTNLGSKTMQRWKIVFANEYDSDDNRIYRYGH